MMPPAPLRASLDLGLECYLVASTVDAVLAQRLMRTVCSHGAERRTPTDEERRALSGLPDTVREGDGCDARRGTGFRGRTGIYELLQIDGAIRDEVHHRSGASVLKRLSTEAGMVCRSSHGTTSSAVIWRSLSRDTQFYAVGRHPVLRTRLSGSLLFPSFPRG